MDDIHTPSVASGPISSHATRNTRGSKSDGEVSLLDLIADKKQIEEELKALSSVLDSLKVRNGTGPRVALPLRVSQSVRTTRARIIRLRNDYKGLLSRIEDGLHAHHAQARNLAVMQSAPASSNPRTSGNQIAPGSSTPEAPFAKVNAVVVGSPAEDAGLRAGDKICRFGNVSWMNHEKLSKIAEEVQTNEGVSFSIPSSKK
ncbi:MAG: hypothetical protein Q9219_002288 [cf. Caloplaca sp. 3 TL-2023]